MTRRKHYTPEFKLEIAKLMVEQNYTLKQACEAAGAGATAVKRWRQQYVAEQSGKPLATRRALAYLKCAMRTAKSTRKNSSRSSAILRLIKWD